jgi:hypothetical protein
MRLVYPDLLNYEKVTSFTKLYLSHLIQLLMNLIQNFIDKALRCWFNIGIQPEKVSVSEGHSMPGLLQATPREKPSIGGGNPGRSTRGSLRVTPLGTEMYPNCSPVHEALLVP